MGWSATSNPNGSFHVVNDADSSHFEAATEDEIHENISELERREQERQAAEESAQAADPHAVAVNSEVTRVN